MNRVLVVFTGGTIGCLADNQGILKVESHHNSTRAEDYYLISRYLEHNHADVSIDVMEPVCVLSENMTIDCWNNLISAVREVDYKKYKGIIITHGTDTMAYTANLFALLLDKYDIPVVFVGSNRNLEDKLCNGHDNFKYAMEFILNYSYAGVYVVWKNYDGLNQIFSGKFISQAANFTNEFTAVRGNRFGYFEQEKFIEEFNYDMVIHEELPGIDEIDTIKECVFMINPYVGLRYDMLSFSDEIKAVLHTTYHSSTFCMAGDRTSIRMLADMCIDKGIDLYIAPYESDLYGSGEGYIYETTKRGLSMGIGTITDVSAEYAYARLLIKYSYGEDIE